MKTLNRNVISDIIINCDKLTEAEFRSKCIEFWWYEGGGYDNLKEGTVCNTFTWESFVKYLIFDITVSNFINDKRLQTLIKDFVTIDVEPVDIDDVSIVYDTVQFTKSGIPYILGRIKNKYNVDTVFCICYDQEGEVRMFYPKTGNVIDFDRELPVEHNVVCNSENSISHLQFLIKETDTEYIKSCEVPTSDYPTREYCFSDKFESDIDLIKEDIERVLQ